MSRFGEIAKLLGMATEDVAKMAPEEMKARLMKGVTNTAAQGMQESKALGNTVHVIPSASEKAAMAKFVENKSPYGSVKMAAVAPVSMGLGDQFNTFKDEVAKPLNSRWEQLKSSLYGPLSKQLNLSKDPEQAKMIESALSTVADPTNLIGGGAGVGLGALQMLGSDEDPKKQK